MRDDRERILDVLEAIERVERYAQRGKAAFEEDELIQNWMLRHLEVIGEACRGVSETLKREHPEIPWSEIVGMRNILAHRYFGIDLEVVWAAIAGDVPRLKRQAWALLAEISESHT